LGFLLCIANQYSGTFSPAAALSIPFIGIFALHLLSSQLGCQKRPSTLSIPFIGIFALHLEGVGAFYYGSVFAFQFPLLGFLLCINHN